MDISLILKIGIIIGIILVFIFIFSLLQFLISIHPPKFYDYKTPKDFNIEYEDISFITSDNVKIKGWLIKSDKADGTVIIGHGYPFDKGNILPVAKFLYPDYNLLFYDHRYFGESEGRITTVGLKEVEDVKSAIKFVKEKFGKDEPIALYGFSLSASAMLMTNQKVNAIIADSAYSNLEDMVEQIYSIFGPFKFPFVKITEMLSKIFFGKYLYEVSPESVIRNSTIPILVIHGEKDSQISVENAYALKKSNPNIELWIVKGADHGYSYAINPNEYKNRIKLFLKNHMRSQ